MYLFYVFQHELFKSITWRTFDVETTVGDIAILELETSATPTSRIASIDRLAKPMEDFTNKECFITGFGATKVSGMLRCSHPLKLYYICICIIEAKAEAEVNKYNNMDKALKG